MSHQALESARDIEPIRIALPSKGHLYDGVVEILKTAGYKVRRASDRQYEATIAGHPRFHVVFMRPTDIVTQVEEGRCQLGVTGLDLFAERAFEAVNSTVVVEDLGYGGCRLVVAVPESWIDVTHVIDLVDLTADFKDSGRSFRVSTKYPALTQAHFCKWGIYYYQLIDSDGALELHPTLGIADIIVDLTSSGITLKDNRLREIKGGTVLDSASCLIGHAPSLARLIEEGSSSPLGLLLDAMDGVRASEGILHLEVVGSPAEPGPETASAVAAYLLGTRGSAHRPRRDLERGGCTRLASNGSDRRDQAERMPAGPLSAGGESGRRPAGPVRVRSGRANNLRYAPCQARAAAHTTLTKTCESSPRAKARP